MRRRANEEAPWLLASRSSREILVIDAVNAKARYPISLSVRVFLSLSPSSTTYVVARRLPPEEKRARQAHLSSRLRLRARRELMLKLKAELNFREENEIAVFRHE